MKIKHVVWNFAGLAVPLIVAATTVPGLIRSIGLERFGLLALAWGMIGYAGIFDLGTGRATTQLISQLRGQNACGSIPSVISAATRLTLKTGAVGSTLLMVSALFGVQKLVQHSLGLENEVTISVILLAFVIPVQAISATYRGVNEAFQNFKGISLLRMVLGVLNFLCPYIVAIFTKSLPWLVSTLLISRLFALIVFRYLALDCVRQNIQYETSEKDRFEYSRIKERLFSFGGWFTVSSIITPLLMQADRFVIASVISATAVAVYTIPYEIVVQSLIVVGAVTTVAFPSLTKLIHEHPDKWAALFRQWLCIVTFVMFLAACALAALLPVILPIWLGKNLPSGSILIGQILCIGLIPYTIGTMFVALIHAHNRPDITAKSHMVEAPVFLTLLFWMVKRYGVQGAAWSWVARVIFDTLLLVTWFLLRNKSWRPSSGVAS